MEKRQEIQEKAVNTFLESGCIGILQVAQRVGKIKLSLDIINKMVQEGKLSTAPAVLIAYPDNRIKDSWEQDMEKWSFKYKEKVDFVNYSSIWKNVLEDYELVILDEIHATSEQQRESIRLLADTTPHVLGLSGTISQETELELRELGLRVIMKYLVEEAIEDGIIAPYRIYIHQVHLDTVFKTLNKKGKMVSEKQQYDAYTYVIEKMKQERKDFKFLALHRNRVLQSSRAKINRTVHLLKKFKDKKVLVFTGLKKVSEALDIPYFHSSSENTGVFEDFKTGAITSLAVVNIGRAGVTFNELEVVILSSFTGNEETTEQIIARALNKDIEGKIVDIHIITSTEEAEIKKLNKALSSFDTKNIIWVK